MEYNEVVNGVGLRQTGGKTTKTKNWTKTKPKTNNRKKTMTPAPDLLIKLASYLWYVVLDIVKPVYADCTAVAYLQFKSKS